MQIVKFYSFENLEDVRLTFSDRRQEFSPYGFEAACRRIWQMTSPEGLIRVSSAESEIEVAISEGAGAYEGPCEGGPWDGQSVAHSQTILRLIEVPSCGIISESNHTWPSHFGAYRWSETKWVWQATPVSPS